MSTKIYPHGKAEFTLAALDDLSVFSISDFKIYIEIDLANFPKYWELNTSGVGGIESTVAATSAARKVRIEAGASPVLYQEGTEANILERRGLRGQATPGVLNATGALTAAMIASGLVTTTAAAGITATLPTGTVMNSSLEMKIGEAFDWSVNSTVGAGTFTVTAAAGHTVIGAMGVVTVTSGVFRTRKTAAATYVTYRIG